MDLPLARTGVNKLDYDGAIWDDLPIMSLNLPIGPPDRFYFAFQQPIHLTKEDAGDRAKMNEVYGECKEQVEGAIEYLRTKRE